jgi:negative regulator of sigma E activity
MEPLSPQDPIAKLLAQARKVEMRSNFAQNVARAARQTPQEHGWLAALRHWWEDVSFATPVGKWAFATVTVAALALAMIIFQTQPATEQQVAQQEAPAMSVSYLPLLPEAAETPWEATFDTQALLAVDDTSQLTDSEIGFLLY